MTDAVLADQRFDDGQHEWAGDNALVAEWRLEWHVHLVAIGAAICVSCCDVGVKRTCEGIVHLRDQCARQYAFKENVTVVEHLLDSRMQRFGLQGAVTALGFAELHVFSRRQYDTRRQT